MPRYLSFGAKKLQIRQRDLLDEDEGLDHARCARSNRNAGIAQEAVALLNLKTQLSRELQKTLKMISFFFCFFLPNEQP